MTVTARFGQEKRALATRPIPDPYPNPPPGRTPVIRLGGHGPTEKVSVSAADLGKMIGRSLGNAILFLDTNVFTTALEDQVWDSILKRQILITPMVWKELQDWVKTPFQNPRIRDIVIKALRAQVQREQGHPTPPNPAPLGDEVPQPKIEVVFPDENYKTHGYEYYLRLLQLRKAMGPAAASLLKTKLGREPTNDEFLAEVQGHLGERGLLLAKKGKEKLHSPNLFTDEQLVVMAFLTAILRGSPWPAPWASQSLRRWSIAACRTANEHRTGIGSGRWTTIAPSLPCRIPPLSRKPKHWSIAG
jgi:hypothetical protein